MKSFFFPDKEGAAIFQNDAFLAGVLDETIHTVPRPPLSATAQLLLFASQRSRGLKFGPGLAGGTLCNLRSV